MSGAVEHKDGGRAFPCDQIIERDTNGYLYAKEIASGGMTLRDYFAAKAMQGIFASWTPEQCNFIDPHKAALDAYEAADAMLKVRQS